MLKNYFLYLVFSVISLYATASYGQDEYTETFQYQYSHAQFDSCIQLIRNLLPKYEKDLPQRIKLLNLLGKSYVRNYQYEEGQEAYTKAAELNKGNRNGLISKDDYIASLLGICDVYAADMQTDSMAVLLDKIEPMIAKNNEHYGHFLLNRGKENFEFEAQLAKKYFRQAINSLSEKNHLIIEAYISLYKIYNYQLKKDEDSAYYHINKAICLSKKNFNSDLSILTSCYIHKGDYIRTGYNIDSAISFIKPKALALADNPCRSYQFVESEIHKLLAICYEFNGNYKKQLDHSKYNVKIKSNLFKQGHPLLAEAHIRLARAFEKLEMLTQCKENIAMAKLSSIDSLSQTSILANYILAVVHTKEGNFDLAHQKWNVLVRTSSRNQSYSYFRYTSLHGKAWTYSLNNEYNLGRIWQYPLAKQIT